MKTIPLVLIALLALAASVQSQDPDSTSAPVAVPTSARILGDIPDGSPPPPQPPKPVFTVAAGDILATSVQQQGGRTITIQRIKPIALPPAPMAAAQVDINDPAIQESIAAVREDSPNEEFLCVAATVFRFKDASARSLVSVWLDGKGEPVTFWSTADFGYLSGCSSYIGSDGITRSLLLLLSTVELDQASALLATHDGEYDPPDISVDPAGQGGFRRHHRASGRHEPCLHPVPA